MGPTHVWLTSDLSRGTLRITGANAKTVLTETLLRVALEKIRDGHQQRPLVHEWPDLRRELWLPVTHEIVACHTSPSQGYRWIP